MKLVIVQEDYIQYLKQYSKDVKENKNSSRPYVGVILKVGNQHYFAPLASPKPKHKTMDDKLDFIKIKKYTKNEDKSPTVRIDFCILSENL